METHERAGIYLRVSTQQQDATNQRRAMTQLAAQRAWQVAWYVEQESGGTDDRPEYQRWLEDARTGQFTVAAVWALDRLGRGGVLSTLLALHELEAAGCSFVSHQEPWINTDSGPLRELLRPILAWIAQQERARRRERTLAGLERARASGTTLGRPRLELDADAARALIGQGYTQQRVAELLGVSRSTLQRRLKARGESSPRVTFDPDDVYASHQAAQVAADWLIERTEREHRVERGPRGWCALAVWQCADEAGGDWLERVAGSAHEAAVAHLAARDLMRPELGQASTLFGVQVRIPGSDEVEAHLVPLHPDPPPCRGDDHDFSVRLDKRNLEGGGAVVREVCVFCGRSRETTTRTREGLPELVTRAYFEADTASLDAISVELDVTEIAFDDRRAAGWWRSWGGVREIALDNQAVGEAVDELLDSSITRAERREVREGTVVVRPFDAW